MDKSNVLENSQLWRQGGDRSRRRDYPDVALDHLLVDNCAMQLVLNPRRFDVVLTENMFGDILSDEGAVLAGSIGMLPSASHRRPAAIRRVGGIVRAGAWLGAGYRRAEQSQPAGRHWFGGGHAANTASD